MLPLQERAWSILQDIDETCVANGWHAISDVWWSHLAETWESPVCVTRGGRRSGKSATYCRKACAVSMAAEPIPGDRAVYSIFSANRVQAADRISTCEQILNLMGYRSILRGEPGEGEIRPGQYGIKLPNGIEIRVVTASVAAAVSATMIGGFCDEVAHWDDNGRNPAEEIVRMILPSMITVPGATLEIASAPKTNKDPHARFYKRAQESRDWSYGHIPTWMGHPALTRERCKDLAQDDYEFLRAYAAEPTDFASALLFPDYVLDRMFLDSFDPMTITPKVCGVDMGLTRNHTAAVIAGRYGHVTGLLNHRIWAPMGTPLIPSQVARDVAAFAHAHRIGQVHADVYHRETLRERIPVVGATTSAIALHGLRRAALNGNARAPSEWTRMRRELGEIEYRDESSVMVPMSPDGSHCDLAIAGAQAHHGATKPGTGRAAGGSLNRGGSGGLTGRRAAA